MSNNNLRTNLPNHNPLGWCSGWSDKNILDFAKNETKLLWGAGDRKDRWEGFVKEVYPTHLVPQVLKMWPKVEAAYAANPWKCWRKK